MANRFPLVLDTTDNNKIKEIQAGDNLNLTDNSITGVQNITALGTIDAADIRVNGNRLVAQAFADLTDTPASFVGSPNYFVKVKADGTGLEYRPLSDLGNIEIDTITVDTSIVPTTDGVGSVGTEDKKFNEIVAATLKGNLLSFNEEIVFNATTGKISYAALQGAPTFLSEFSDDVGYLRTADLDSTLAGLFDEGVPFATDIVGSVFGDDSTVLVDGVSNIITGNVINTSIDTAELTASQITSTAVTAQLFEGPPIGNMQIDAGASGIINIGAGVSTTTVNIENAVIETFDQGSGLGVAQLTADTDLAITAGNRVRIEGNIPFRLSHVTATELLAIGAQEGDVVYNTTTSRLQMYQGGAWKDVNGNVEATAGQSDFNDVIIAGNLTVQGTTTSVETTNTTITDNVIVLNNGETGAGVTNLSAGIEIDRGSEANVEFIWDEGIDRWSIGAQDFTALGLHSTSITGTGLGNITQYTNITGTSSGTISGFANVTGSGGGIISQFAAITGTSGGTISQFTNITGDSGGTISQFTDITGDSGGTISQFTDITGDSGGTISQFTNITGDSGGDITQFTNITGDSGGTISQFTNITGDGGGTISGFAFSGNLTGNVDGDVTGNLDGDVTGNIDNDALTVGATATTVQIGHAGSITTINGTVQLPALVAGEITADDSISITTAVGDGNAISIGPQGTNRYVNLTADYIRFFGAVTNNIDAQGGITGDLKGSVVADDSTVMIDGQSGTIVGPIASTTISGTTITATTSIKTGSITTLDTSNDLTITASDSIIINGAAGVGVSSIILDHAGINYIELKTEPDNPGNPTDYARVAINAGTNEGDVRIGTPVSARNQVVEIYNAVVNGELVGNVTGTVTGAVVGDVVGSVFADDSAPMVDALNYAMFSDTLTLTPLNAPPDLPTNGMIAVADGTGWNPAANGKNTLVAYLGGDWVTVAAAA